MDYTRVDPDAVSLAAGARAGRPAQRSCHGTLPAPGDRPPGGPVHDDKLSVRDAAAVLGVSFGRVQQLVRDRAR